MKASYRRFLLWVIFPAVIIPCTEPSYSQSGVDRFTVSDTASWSICDLIDYCATLTVRSNVVNDVWYLEGEMMGPTGPTPVEIFPETGNILTIRVEKEGYVADDGLPYYESEVEITKPYQDVVVRARLTPYATPDSYELARSDGERGSTQERERILESSRGGSREVSARSDGTVKVKDSGGDTVTLYTDSHALLIGVSEYDDWDSLPSIPGELEEVDKALFQQGFNVTTVLNPDFKTLKKSIEKFIYAYGHKTGHRLLIYYSGHGHTWREKELGYLVPTDAPLPISDARPGTSFERKALPISQMVEWSRHMSAKHVLFVFDSCFSGTIFKVGRSQFKMAEPAPKFILNSAIRPVRQFITAGKAGEKVPATSKFTPEFVDAIRYGKGDLNNDGYVTGTELGLHLQQLIPEYKKQTPQFGNHPDYSLSRGDFVFISSVGLNRH